MKRSDIKLFEQATRQRWKIDPEYRDAMIRRLVSIIADPSSTKREVTAASRALIAAEAQNQHDELNEADEIRERIIAIATRLGIDVAAIGSVDAAATTDPQRITDHRADPA